MSNQETNQENQDREYLLREEVVKKAMITMIIPSILAGILNQFNIILDTYFLGNFAYYPVASQTATATVMPLVFIMNAVSFMLCIGTAVCVSRLLGKGDRKNVQRYMANAFAAGWIIYFIILVAGFLFIPSFVALLTGFEAGNPVYDNSYIYSLVFVIGYPTVVFQMLASQTLRAEGRSKLIVRLSIIQVIINALVNYVLISDRFPSISFYGSNYEAAGAAIATIVSQAVMAVMLYTQLFSEEKSSFYIKFKNTKFDKVWLQDVSKNGLPQFFASSLFALGTFLVSLSIVNLSARLDLSTEQGVGLQAASGITVRVVLMMFLLINGIVQGIQGFISYQYGAGNKERLVEGINYVKSLGIKLGVLFSLVFLIFARQIAGIFSSEPIVIDLVTMSFRVFGVTMAFFPLAHHFFGLFAAVGHQKLAVKCTFLRDGFFFSGFAVILPIFFGVNGVMLILPTSLLLGSLVILTLGLRILKQLNKDLDANN